MMDCSLCGLRDVTPDHDCLGQDLKNWAHTLNARVQALEADLEAERLDSSGLLERCKGLEAENADDRQHYMCETTLLTDHVAALKAERDALKADLAASDARWAELRDRIGEALDDNQHDPIVRAVCQAVRRWMRALDAQEDGA